MLSPFQLLKGAHLIDIVDDTVWAARTEERGAFAMVGVYLANSVLY